MCFQPRLRWVACLLGIPLLCVVNLGATTVRPPQFADLVSHSTSVVRAETTAVHCEWRGAAPDRRIVTIVTVQVLRHVVGAAPDVMDLEFLGGSLEGETLRVTGQPQFRPGDRDILFVENNGGQICPLANMMYGRYPIVRDPANPKAEFVARENGEAIESVDDVARPFGAPRALAARNTKAGPMTVTTFEGKIRQVAAELGRKDIAAP